MSEWQVTAHQMPYNFHDPRIFVVEAESRTDAYATVFDRLTREGIRVKTSDAWSSSQSSSLGFTPDEMDDLTRQGVPNQYGDCTITSVIPYQVKPKGRIVSERG